MMMMVAAGAAGAAPFSTTTPAPTAAGLSLQGWAEGESVILVDNEMISWPELRVSELTEGPGRYKYTMEFPGDDEPVRYATNHKDIAISSRDHVYIYTKMDDWILTQELDVAGNLAMDGNFLLIAGNATVMIYRFETGLYRNINRLQNPDDGTFGDDVAMAGNDILVKSCDALYFYKIIDDDIIFVKKFSEKNFSFWSLALSAGVAVVGRAKMGEFSANVYRYEGNTWNFTTRIAPNDVVPYGSLPFFSLGNGLAISDDGTFIAGVASSVGSNGAVYFFFGDDFQDQSQLIPPFSLPGLQSTVDLYRNYLITGNLVYSS